MLSVAIVSGGRLAQLARAPGLHPGCRGFKSLTAHHLFFSLKIPQIGTRFRTGFVRFLYVLYVLETPVKSYGSYLLRIGQTFYFRIMVPKHLRRSLRCNEWKKSLRTSQLDNAMKWANLIHSYVTALFNRAGEEMFTEKQVWALVDEYVNILLQKNEDATNRNVAEGKMTSAQNMEKNFIATAKEIRQGLADGETIYALAFLDWLQSDKSIVPEDDIEKTRFCRELLKRVPEAMTIAAKRMAGDYDNDFDRRPPLKRIDEPEAEPMAAPVTSVPPAIPAAPVTTPVTSQLLSMVHAPSTGASVLPTTQPEPGNAVSLAVLMEKYFKEKTGAEEWTSHALTELKAHFDLFKEHFGQDTPVTRIEYDDMQKYRDEVLKRLPTNRRKSVTVRNLNLAAQLADNTVPKINVKTIKDYLASINTFLQWCVRKKYLHTNLMDGISIKDRRQANTKKLPYANEELRQIVTELAHLPLKGENGIKNIDRRWIVLLGLYQGMRENEICQLGIDDIAKIGTIACILIRVVDPELNSIKNDNSIRIIPIHRQLLALGFLEFVEQRRNERESLRRKRKIDPEIAAKRNQLFKTMSYGKAKGSYTKNFLSFYTKFNRTITSSPLKTFHSFRHNFSSQLTNSSTIPYAVSYLTGHAQKNMTSKVYTVADMTVLAEELVRLDYGIDLFEAFHIPQRSPEIVAEQVIRLPNSPDDIPVLR